MGRPVDVKKGKGRYCSRSCTSVATFALSNGFGADNPNWKGGETRGHKGYWFVKKRGHPRASKSGYVKRATLVLEAKLGRFLVDGEIAHHKNEIKDDDAPDNLELMLSADHVRLHHPEKVKHPVRRSPTYRRYNWPEDDELLKMSETQTLRKIASSLGCSWSIVGKRIKRLRKGKP